MEEHKAVNTNVGKFLEELTKRLKDPVHRRLLAAYSGEQPLEAMEKELRAIVEELVGDED